MSEYNKAHFHLRARQERENALASPHQWQREQYLAMAAVFERLAQQHAPPDTPGAFGDRESLIDDLDLIASSPFISFGRPHFA
jgi:hypothetical protein